MRVLVLGGAGMLGHKVCQVLARPHEVLATFRRGAPNLPSVFMGVRPIENVDARELASVRQIIESHEPDVVVNAVGIVKQRSESNDPLAMITVNSLLPHYLASACRDVEARLIQVSTDCVFSGMKGNYRENDVPDPTDLYGRSKLLGEVVDESTLTIRTSMIGRELANRQGLVEWFLDQAGSTVQGFANAIFSGLTTQALASIISASIDKRLSGLWHVSSDPISKYDLLVALNAAFGTRTKIERNEVFRCDRSLNSDRFWTATGLTRPRWADMVAELARDQAPYNAVPFRHGKD